MARGSRPANKPAAKKKAARPAKSTASSHAPRRSKAQKPKKPATRPAGGGSKAKRSPSGTTSRDRARKQREQAQLAKQREHARLEKQREQARQTKQREQARLAKEREHARLEKQREQARQTKQREQARLAKQRELEKAKQLKEREAKQQALQQVRERERAAKAAERDAAKVAQQQAREQQLAEKSQQREAAKLARDEERQRAQAERERQREESRRAKEEERARKDAEREAYRKAKEAERERLRAEREAARRALEGKVARATKRAHRADGMLGRSSTARLYSAAAIPDQSGTTRRSAEAEQLNYARFANLRPPVAPIASPPPAAPAAPLPAVAPPPAVPSPPPVEPAVASEKPEPPPRVETAGPRLPPEEPEDLSDSEPPEEHPESSLLEDSLDQFDLGDAPDESSIGEGATESMGELGDLEELGELGGAPTETAEGEEPGEATSMGEGGTTSAVASPTPVPKFDVSTVEDRQSSIEERLAQTDEEFRRNYIESLDMSWIYHDSALEGVVYTFQELKTAIDPNITVVPDSSLQPVCEEIRRHKAAIDLVRELALKKKEPITVDTIKRIYLTLHPEEGDLKSVKYRKDIPQHRLYFHEYAAPDKIAYKVRQTVDWLSGPEPKKIKNPVRIAGRVHYDLLRVFPFPTDSGKVARLLMNLVLLRSGYPPAIIHSTERQRYYEALKGALPVILSMVNEAIQNGLQSIEKILDEQETRMRSFVS